MHKFGAGSVLALAVSVLGLAGCSSTSTQAKNAGGTMVGRTSVASSSAATIPSPPPTPTVADLRSVVLTANPAFSHSMESAQLLSFRSPSGNISCSMVAVGGSRVVCTIYTHDAWPTATECGQKPIVVKLDPAGPRTAGCTSSTPKPVTTELPYGQSVFPGGNQACSDMATGLTCVDLNTGAGFQLSRQAFTAIPAQKPVRSCSADELNALQIQGAEPPGHRKIDQLRTTPTGPLWAAYRISSLDQGGQPATALVYCGSSGWMQVSFGSSAGCAYLTPTQLPLLDPGGGCTAIPAATYPDAMPPATKLATSSCQIWAYGDTLDAASGSSIYKAGGEQARDAAMLEPKWNGLATWMTFVAGLPLTDNTAADVAKAQVYLPQIKQTCSSLGVKITF